MNYPIGFGKSLHHMTTEEIAQLSQFMACDGTGLAIQMYGKICAALDPTQSRSNVLIVNVWEPDIPEYSYTYNYGCSSAFVLPNFFIINLMNLYEAAHGNATTMGISDMSVAFHAMLAHEILLCIARSGLNGYSHASQLIPAYEYATEKYVWDTLYPAVQSMLKKTYKIDFPAQILDTTAGKIYTTKYSPFPDYIQRLFYTLATIFGEPDQVPEIVYTFNGASRFILNLSINGVNHPGIMLIDQCRPIESNIQKAYDLISSCILNYFTFKVRMNCYGENDRDVQLSLILDPGLRYPFICNNQIKPGRV